MFFSNWSIRICHLHRQMKSCRIQYVKNDVWGISENEELFIILSQTEQTALPIVLERLENDGFICHEMDAPAGGK